MFASNELDIVNTTFSYLGLPLVGDRIEFPKEVLVE
jgi:hypothetical protein